jgi:hypothetical protein
MLCLWNFEFTEIYGINIFYTRNAKQQCQEYHLVNIYVLRHLDCFCTRIGDEAGHSLPMSEAWLVAECHSHLSLDHAVHLLSLSKMSEEKP